MDIKLKSKVEGKTIKPTLMYLDIENSNKKDSGFVNTEVLDIEAFDNLLQSMQMLYNKKKDCSYFANHWVLYLSKTEISENLDTFIKEFCDNNFKGFPCYYVIHDDENLHIHIIQGYFDLNNKKYLDSLKVSTGLNL